MTARAAAHRYARALFDVALKERADLEAIERALAGFADLLRAHEPLSRVMLNPAVPAPRKRAAVEQLAGLAAAPPVLARLLVLLAERDRLVILPDLVEAYRVRLMDHQQVLRAEVTTALPLAADRLGRIEKALAGNTGRRVTLTTRVDPGIMGGLVARVGDTVFDASVATQLEKLRHRLSEGGR
jgi:F-type H+-transporting ATPase subunit delta